MNGRDQSERKWQSRCCQSIRGRSRITMLAFLPTFSIRRDRTLITRTSIHTRPSHFQLRCAESSAPPLIIGLNQYSHDTSIAIINAVSGSLLFALSKERLTRRKHDGGDVADLVPHALSAVAVDCGVSLDAITESVRLVVANNHHFRIRPFEARLPFQVSLNYVPENYLSPWNLIGSNVSFVRDPVAPNASKIELSHHLAHAFSAISDSPYRRGLVVIMDGMGESLDDMLHASAKTNSPPDYYSELSRLHQVCTDHPAFKQYPSDVFSRPGVSFREAETAYIFQREEQDWSVIRLQRVYKRWTPENAPPELTNHSFEEMDSVGAMYSRVSSIIFKNWNVCGKVRAPSILQAVVYYD